MENGFARKAATLTIAFPVTLVVLQMKVTALDAMALTVMEHVSLFRCICLHRVPSSSSYSKTSISYTPSAPPPSKPKCDVCEKEFYENELRDYCSKKYCKVCYDRKKEREMEAKLEAEKEMVRKMKAKEKLEQERQTALQKKRRGECVNCVKSLEDRSDFNELSPSFIEYFNCGECKDRMASNKEAKSPTHVPQIEEYRPYSYPSVISCADFTYKRYTYSEKTTSSYSPQQRIRELEQQVSNLISELNLLRGESETLGAKRVQTSDKSTQTWNLSITLPKLNVHFKTYETKK
jgi:hypothetical protein